MGLFDFLRRGNRVLLPLPEDRAELMRSVLEMTPFDLLVGTLCSQYYRESPDPDQVVHYGALGAFHQTLEKAVAGEVDADSMLSKHASKNADAEQMVSLSGEFADVISGHIWNEVTASAERSGAPVSVSIVTILVQVVEKRFKRPKGARLRGHFTIVVEFVTAAALHLAKRAPERARFLAQEEV